MLDLLSDSVLLTTNGPVAAVQQMLSSKVAGSLIEANTKLIAALGAKAQAQEGEALSECLSGRLTVKDFMIQTDCSVCQLPKMTMTWVWKKGTLVDTSGVIQDWRSDLKLQHTLICKECYEGAIHNGSLQTEEGQWMFDTEYAMSPHGQQPEVPCLPTILGRYQLQHAQPGKACQDKCMLWTQLVGMAHEGADDVPLNAEPIELTGVSVDTHIEGN